jgi:hypothetical protein
MLDKMSKEELIKKIRQIEKSDKRKDKEIDYLKSVNEAQKRIIKHYVPKIDKEVVKKTKNECCGNMSNRKFLKGIGINRSTFYYLPKEKALTDKTIDLIENIKYVWAKNRCVYGRNKLLIALNRYLISIYEQSTTDSRLRKLMRLLNIKSKLNRKERRKDPKNTKVNFKNLIKRKFGSNERGKKLFTDVTYFKTPFGFVYISVIIDTYDCKILA